MVCTIENETVVAHHLLRAGDHSMGSKAGDNHSVPLCYLCHADLHAWGDEVGYYSLKGWEYEYVLDYALTLWEEFNG